MILVRHAPRLVHVRSWLAALAVASLLAAVLAGSAAAQSGPTLLSSPTVSPLAGDPTTLIQFGVRWVNHQGSAPAYVDVVIDGTAHPMAVAAADFKGGATYSYETTLPAGTHAISFEAGDTRKFTSSLDGGTVTITPPPPPPPPPTGTTTGTTGTTGGTTGSTTGSTSTVTPTSTTSGAAGASRTNSGST
ncbi:MAG: hypothetical protein ACXWNG_01340, partial [Candidatus Limnocylindrales bacterium]